MYHPSSGALSGEAPAQPPTCAYGTLTSRFPVTNRPHSWAIHARRAGTVGIEELARSPWSAAAGHLWWLLRGTKSHVSFHGQVRAHGGCFGEGQWLGMVKGDSRAFDPRKSTSGGEAAADLPLRGDLRKWWESQRSSVRVTA